MKLPSFLKTKKYCAKHIYGKDRKLQILLVISLACSIFLFFIGILIFLDMAMFVGNILTGMDFIVFGLLTAIGPIGFYNHVKAKRKREIEEHLPDFLREISSSTSSGMTIFDAIKSAAREDHGNLTPELKIMAAQLSWGISVKEALENFSKRVNTSSVKRMAITINKALEIGGNTSAIFEAAAREIDQAKLIESQRKADMSLYSIVIFISFFVFLAVVLIIHSTIFQAIFELQGKVAGANVGGIKISQIDPAELKNIFFLFVIVQSVGGGLLGGFMMDGKLSSGVRFGFVLILVSFVIFKFMI